MKFVLLPPNTRVAFTTTSMFPAVLSILNMPTNIHRPLTYPNLETIGLFTWTNNTMISVNECNINNRSSSSCCCLDIAARQRQ